MDFCSLESGALGHKGCVPGASRFSAPPFCFSSLHKIAAAGTMRAHGTNHGTSRIASML